MKSLRTFALLSLLMIDCLVGQTPSAQLAPASVANAIYNWGGSASESTAFSVLYFLKADGTYEVLLISNQASSNPTTYQDPGLGGTYHYTVTGATTAVLEFDGAHEGPHRLTFRTANDGTLKIDQSLSLTFSLGIPNSTESLIATSLRSRINNGSTSIAGLAIAGSRSRFVLVRAVGPGLANFNLQDVLPDPVFAIYNSKGEKTVYNGVAWSSSPVPAESYRRLMRVVGMYALPDNSKDAVVLAGLSPGTYTIQCSSPSRAAGDVVIECYLLP